MKSWTNDDIPNNQGFVPEKKLLAAVLQRAVADYLTTFGDLKEGARVWLMEDIVPEGTPLSFRYVCEALELDMENLRTAVKYQAENNPEFTIDLQEAV